jgi:hypothetical protein
LNPSAGSFRYTIEPKTKAKGSRFKVQGRERRRKMDDGRGMMNEKRMGKVGYLES